MWRLNTEYLTIFKLSTARWDCWPRGSELLGIPNTTECTERVSLLCSFVSNSAVRVNVKKEYSKFSHPIVNFLEVCNFRRDNE